MSGAGYLAHDWFPQPVPDNVVIGARSWLYSSFAFRHFHATSADALAIGDDTGIYDGTFFDLGPDAIVRVGNFVTIVGAIMSTNGSVTIDDYVFIAHEVVLADRAGASPPSISSPLPTGVARECRAIRIRENAWIGARAVLLGGADIGRNAIIGAASIVDFPVPDDAVVAGNPARVVRVGPV